MKTSLRAIAGLTLCGLAGTAGADVVLFQDNFEGAAPSPKWSSNTIVTRDSAFTYFNGRNFNGMTSTLTLTAPPAPAPGTSYEFTLRFDLYIIDSWDGDDIGAGPDRFQVNLNGASIFNHSFANQHDLYDYRAPDVGPTHLGFNSAFKDSIYRGITLPFNPGTANPIVFSFHDTTTQGVNDESWGIDNVTVSYRTVPAPGSLAMLSLAGFATTRRRRS